MSGSGSRSTRADHGRRGRRALGVAFALILVSGGLFSAAPLTAAPLYGAPYLSYPVGRGPIDIALNDFDGDGAFDLVTADFLAGTLTLYQGQFDGQFRAPRVVAEIAAPTSLLASDLDFDGDQDLVVTSYDPGLVVILKNDGTGAFFVSQELLAEGGPVDAVLADADFDLRADLVVANFLNGTVGVYQGFAGGGYSEEPVGVRVGVQPIAVVAGDLNGDGMGDLVTANYGSSDITLLPADPGGGYRPGVPYPLSPRPTTVVGRDLNGDGRLDLVVGFDSQGVLASLRSDTGFSFENQTAYATGGERVSALQFADLNRDGLSDLVVLDDKIAGFRVLRGLGNGGFAIWEHSPGGEGPTGVGAADFNEDGVIDLALTCVANSEVGIHLGTGNGRFGVEHRMAAPSRPLLLSGDLDGNGVGDVVALGRDPAAPGLAVWLSSGGAALIGGGPGPTVEPVEAAVLADLDGDGRLDLVVAEATTQALRIFRGDGAGGLVAAEQFPSGGPVSALLAADLTGDGRVDLAVALETEDRVDLYLGDPTAAGGLRAGALLPVGRGPRCLAAADFDGDGWRDLAVGLRAGHRLIVFAGSATGPGGAAAVVLDDLTPTALLSPDLNADGRPDLVLVTEAPGELRLLRATGGLAFATTATGATANGPVDLDLADLNGDGRADFLIGCQDSGVLTTWLSVAGGELRSRADFGVGAGPGSGAVRALNPGARPRLVAAAGGPEGGLLSLAAGEGLTPVELLDLAGERTPGGIRLHGRVGGDWRGGVLGIFRLEEGGGATEICRPAVIQGTFACLDPAPPDGSVSYQADLAEPDGTWRRAGPIEIGPLAMLDPTLRVGPNPFRGALRIEWTLPRAGAARITLLDAAGRRVAGLDPGPQPAGPGRIEWDGRGPGGEPLPAGIYWLRFEGPDRSVTRRLVRLR